MADMSLTDKLCNASARGNLSEVLLCLEKGADVNGFNKFGRTALQVVMLGSVAVVEALLKKGANPNLCDPVRKLTVTHDAAREGFWQTVCVLMEYGADINMLDEGDNLPLHLAAKNGYLEVVKVLIGHTADPHKSNSDGHTAAQLARDHGKMETAKYINDFFSSH